MIRVLIADDFPMMAGFMKKLIEDEVDMTVCDILTTFGEVVEGILEIDHEVVLMNDYLHPTNSVTASQALRELGIEAPIVVISMHEDAELIRDSLEAGANGFMMKEECLDHLIPAICTVFAGEQYLSPIAQATLGSAEASS